MCLAIEPQENDDVWISYIIAPRRLPRPAVFRYDRAGAPGRGRPEFKKGIMLGLGVILGFSPP